MEDTPALKHLRELGEDLSRVLDSEFDALNSRDVSALEDYQTQKVTLLDEVLKAWGKLPKGDNSDEYTKKKVDDMRILLRSCKQKHERNDIVLRKQIEEVKLLLENLLNQKHKTPSDVYNKMGKIIS